MRGLTTLLLVLAMMAAGGYVAYTTLAPSGPPRTTAEQLIADNLYRPGQRYHVEDLQARPAVAAALARLKAAGICDLFFRQDTHKMSSDVKRVRLCGPPTDDLEARRAREYSWFSGELYQPELPGTPDFAVFSDADGTMYLIAQGKHGSHSADEMEQVILAVVDRAIADLPAKIAAKSAGEAKSRADADAAAEARKRAQESFQ